MHIGRNVAVKVYRVEWDANEIREELLLEGVLHAIEG